jgi:hypothetical protein
MDFLQAQEFLAKAYPDKKIIYEFDEKCHRFHELVYTDGVPNPVHHVENNRVKVTVEGLEPMYVPIAPHRECYTWEAIKALILSKPDPI